MLTDTQIERYSRQIILPQVGGNGQERLLQSSVAIAGAGAVAEVAALYLAGAGIGRIVLHGRGRAALRSDLLELNPDVEATVSDAPLGVVSADVLVACDVAVKDIDAVAMAGRPFVAAGGASDRGWLVVVDDPNTCVSCAARVAILECGGLPPLWGGSGGGDQMGFTPASPPTPKRQQAAALQSALPRAGGPTAGVIGSLVALAVLKLRLGVDKPQPGWLQFDGVESMLTRQPLARAFDCPRCTGA